MIERNLALDGLDSGEEHMRASEVEVCHSLEVLILQRVAKTIRENLEAGVRKQKKGNRSGREIEPNAGTGHQKVNCQIATLMRPLSVSTASLNPPFSSRVSDRSRATSQRFLRR